MNPLPKNQRQPIKYSQEYSWKVRYSKIGLVHYAPEFTDV